jgi:hypothetical protein
VKERKVTYAQENRARREMLAAIDIYRRRGLPRQQVIEIAGSMYDFQVMWAETAAGIADDPDREPHGGMG